MLCKWCQISKQWPSAARVVFTQLIIIVLEEKSMDHQFKMDMNSGELYQDAVVDEFGVVSVDGYVEIEDATEPSNLSIEEIKSLSHELMVGESETLPTTKAAFNDKVNEIVDKLLAEQADNPFKKGGEGIAWNPDFLLFKMRQQLSLPEQTLLDIISGMVSSNPAQDSYVIVPAEIKDKLKFNERYTYDMLKTAQEKLDQQKIPIEFTVGKKKVKIVLPLFDAIAFVEGKNGKENNYISVIPSPILRMFLSSATVLHGGYYKVLEAAQIQSNYTRILYYLLESKKKYRENPRADEGRFIMMLEDLQNIIGYPKSYRFADVKSKVLEPAKKTLNEIEGIDITFEYTPYKAAVGTARKKTVGISVWVIPRGGKIEEKSTKELPGKKENTAEQVAMEAALQSLQYTEKEISSLIKACAKHDRSIAFLMKAAMQVEAQADTTDSKGALLMSFIKEGEFFSAADKPKKKVKKKDSFHNFNEREYSEEEMNAIVNSVSKKAD